MLVLLTASSLSRGAEVVTNRWHAWQARRRIEHLPPITVSARANYFQPWTSPSPDYRPADHPRSRATPLARVLGCRAADGQRRPRRDRRAAGGRDGSGGAPLGAPRGGARAGLERLIREPLEVHREPWELAVGRGLGE